MHPDGGLQAVVGIVLAFSLLWTVAVLIPDNSASAGTLGLPEDRTRGDAKVIHATSPLIFHRNIIARINSESSRPPATQTRILFESTRPTATEMKSKLSFKQSQRHKTKKTLFPAYFWYLTVLFLYKTRNFVNKRKRAPYDCDDESFFRKSGLNSSLQYSLDFEDPNNDFISVYHSNYGSALKWTPELDKFDLELELTDSQI